jgi:hypothetical protein
MAESRGSDSNVELNDMQSNQTSSPKKREKGIRSRAQETGRFPRLVNEEIVASQWLQAEAVTPL